MTATNSHPSVSSAASRSSCQHLGLGLAFVVPLILYFRCAAPGVFGGDSAELTAGAYYLSFVHPPGYPLYLLLGKLFTCLPVGDIAFRVTLMSVFFAAADVALLYLLLVRLLRHVPAALLTALAFAFAFTFWGQATIAEVYVLNIFLLLLLFHLALSWDRASAEAKRWRLLLFALLMGLALCNHVSPILFVPAFAYFAWSGGFRPHRQPATVLAMVLLTAAGLSLYLYLPIRALSDPPVINWPKPESLDQILTQVTAAQFRQQMFALPVRQLLYNLAHAAGFLFAQFPVVGCVLGVAGIRTALRRERRWGLFLVIAGSVLLLYDINYDIDDIEVYYLPVYLCFAVFLGFELREAWERWRSVGARVCLVIALFVPYVPVYRALGVELDRSDAYGWTDLAAALDSLPTNSTVIAVWPHFTTLRYQQLVTDHRHDVLLVEIDSLDPSRHLEEIQRYHDRGGPVYFSRDTALAGAQYNLEADGFFLRLAPKTTPDPLPAVADGVQVGNGLQVAARCDGPGRRRHFLSVELLWTCPEPPAGGRQTPPRYQLVLTAAGSRHAIIRQRLYPVQAGFPRAQWRPGATYRQRRLLYVPQGTPATVDLKLLTDEEGQPFHSFTLQTGIPIAD